MKEIPELKNVYDPEERKRLLKGAFEANPDAISGQRTLLVDDLYRSGATMNEITEVLLASGARKFTHSPLRRRGRRNEESICRRFAQN